MDIEGIDVAVMYGTRGRQILCHDESARPGDVEVRVARPASAPQFACR
jgi:hypothetical protein